MKHLFFLLTTIITLYAYGASLHSNMSAQTKEDNDSINQSKNDSTTKATSDSTTVTEKKKEETEETRQERYKREGKTVYFVGALRDKFTKGAVDGAHVTLMTTDSTIVDTITVKAYNSYSSGFGKGTKETHYMFMIKPEPADFIIKFEHPEYETLYLNHSIKKISKRTMWEEGAEAMMRRIKRAQQTDSLDGGLLNEVVVKATKVKMVWKGDTLVFNADAFNVPEGSMLDGLIKQLPGVELNEQGEIFVNGKKIENLTLNGADFFKGKNKIMLENLPYFTVKDIKVYNKQTEMNQFLGVDDEDKKEYTMDVTLKKEYRGGGSGNFEVGYGTDDRYKAKAFGMHFTDWTRAVLFGGLNNVNETTEYDSYNESEKTRTNASGDRHFYQIGGMFAYRSKDDKFKNNVNMNSTWTDDRTRSRYNSETFLTTGNSFSRSQSERRSKPISLDMTDRLDWRFSKKMYMMSNFNLSYRRTQSESESNGLTATDQLMTDSVNSTRSRSWSRSGQLRGYGNLTLARVSNTGNYITLSLKADGSKTYSPESYSQSRYYYHKTQNVDDRNIYSDNAPVSYSYSVEMEYNYRLSKAIRLTPYYEINPSYSSTDSRQYRLDLLSEEWATDGSHAFRSLPSTRDSLLLAYDTDNSRSQRTRSLVHQTGLRLGASGNIHKEKGYYYISLTLPMRFLRNSMDYRSEALTTSLTKHYTMFTPNLYSYIVSGNKNRKELRGSYYISKRQPSTFDLIDRTDASDPLNITLGNPGLKSSTTHDYHIEGSLRHDSINERLSLLFDGNFTRNAFANGYTYDPETGVRTFRAENIKSGNWYFNTRLNYGRDLGKKKFFHFESEVSFTLEKSTDLANVSGATTSELSRVRMNELKIKPSLNYQRGDLSLRFQHRTQWRHYSRSLEIAETLPDNTWDISWTLNGTYKMPWQLTFDTTLELIQRRGYADSEMNDNRLYWDASLTKSLKQGRWLLKLRGYDILGQVSNLRYSVNAQGRTETWTNSMRRYALLTIAYKLTQKKKEEKK